MPHHVVGIDLGTTNSEVAAFVNGKVQVLGRGKSNMLPSCVGISPTGELLVGQAARNQQLLYPERTVRSIKRKMGSADVVTLGDKSFSPQEISALILRELAEWARESLNGDVEKAVITVPAYFSDAQRQATREAGALAGLEVVRILNEPTAASLAYGFGDGPRQTAMVYDLGGGTFDVSIVSIEGDVTEVLASHGNNHLGGDDFDDLLMGMLAEAFQKEHGIDPLSGEHPIASARLWQAAEEAKKQLSFEQYVMVREEALITVKGKPLHLEMEVSRQDYEHLIEPLVETTLESVTKAMRDAGVTVSDIDAVLLVGGSTRTPLVARVLEERVGVAPKQDIHPDLCVALGAGVLASRSTGHDVNRILVDVSPFTFGISHLGELDGVYYHHCYKPIIVRNTPLPITRTELFQTSYPRQDAVHIEVFQGDDPDALRNIPVGDFIVEGLTLTEEPNVIMCRMNLDLDGILHVTAIEKCSGLSKHITIENALQPKSPEETAKARKKLDSLYATWTKTFAESAGDDDDDDSAEVRQVDVDMDWDEDEEVEEDAAPMSSLAEAPEAYVILERSRALLDGMNEDDKEEAIGLHEQIEDALAKEDPKALHDAVGELRELLFFVEGNK